MRVKDFRIENFKNISLAEGKDLPNFVVICGGNGSGKSSILKALLTFRNFLASKVDKKPNRFKFENDLISANSNQASIQINFQFTDEEIEFIKRKFDGKYSLPKEHSIKLILEKKEDLNHKVFPDDMDDFAVVPDMSSYISDIQNENIAINHILYDHKTGVSMMDYFSAYRGVNNQVVNSWNSSFLNKEQEKQTLINETNKYANIKQYLTGIKIDDLRRIQLAQKKGETFNGDSLTPIREFFNEFFAPMEFLDIDLTITPFKYIINTPKGEIDIDGLSSGEKEILYTYVHFKRFNTRDSVILFDEPDAHLHPELERSYLKALKNLSSGNQFFVTTHSPNIMAETGSHSLYTVLKYSEENENQFRKITDDEEKHDLLSEIMGSKGFVSLNRKIIFIEGETSSIDIEIFEKFYPPIKYSLSFIPVGNSATVTNVAEKVNMLLTSSIGYENFYSIIDGDYPRLEDDPTNGKKLFRLSVYHAENLLLDEVKIFQAVKKLKSKDCNYSNPEDVQEELKKIVLESPHINSYSKAMLESKLAKEIKEFSDKIHQSTTGIEFTFVSSKPSFDQIIEDAQKELKESIINSTWKKTCKGREVLKGFCSKNQLKYADFKNLLLSEFNESNPPQELSLIMQQILN